MPAHVEREADARRALGRGVDVVRRRGRLEELKAAARRLRAQRGAAVVGVVERAADEALRVVDDRARVGPNRAAAGRRAPDDDGFVAGRRRGVAARATGERFTPRPQGISAAGARAARGTKPTIEGVRFILVEVGQHAHRAVLVHGDDRVRRAEVDSDRGHAPAEAERGEHRAARHHRHADQEDERGRRRRLHSMRQTTRLQGSLQHRRRQRGVGSGGRLETLVTSSSCKACSRAPTPSRARHAVPQALHARDGASHGLGPRRARWTRIKPPRPATGLGPDGRRRSARTRASSIRAGSRARAGRAGRERGRARLGGRRRAGRRALRTRHQVTPLDVDALAAECGVNLDEEPYLLWILREMLYTPLPPHWRIGAPDAGLGRCARVRERDDGRADRAPPRAGILRGAALAPAREPMGRARRGRERRPAHAAAMDTARGPSRWRRRPRPRRSRSARRRVDGLLPARRPALLLRPPLAQGGARPEAHPGRRRAAAAAGRRAAARARRVRPQLLARAHGARDAAAAARARVQDVVARDDGRERRAQLDGAARDHPLPRHARGDVPCRDRRQRQGVRALAHQREVRPALDVRPARRRAAQHPRQAVHADAGCRSTRATGCARARRQLGSPRTGC